MDEKLRILLCEDDENLGMLLREYLQAKDYDADLCSDGEAGYKAFLKVSRLVPMIISPSLSLWRNLYSVSKLFCVV